MKGQSREQHVACVNPKPAATLGTSRSQFMLLDFTVVAVMQRIFSSIRYCSYFITLEIEPRNIIIDLCVGYHCEQENKLFSASVSISLTKIVGWVHFLPPSSQRQPVPFPVQKEENYSRKKKKINFCLFLEFEEKKGKKSNYTNGTSIPPFLFNASEPARSYFQVIYSYNNVTGTGFGGGGRLIVRNRERTLACVNGTYPQALFFQGRKGLLETCADSIFQ